MDSPATIPKPTPPAAQPTVADLIRELAERFNPAIVLDRAGLAAILLASEPTIDRMRAAGEIGPAAFKVRGGLRWHRGEVLSWLANRTSAGELHDSTTWPATKAMLDKRKG
jgi:hypothetical protein